MAQVLKEYLNNIDNIEDQIDQELDKILQAIDLDRLLQNPKPYMEELSKQFFESLDDEIRDAIKAGESKANRIINNIA